ncbi:hypothetical protein GM661_11815 [Iocasia frigidifontis]|uniref:Uncharacterized protein n=1 Tax=Iocasia fonsfrigidae TaxID=2682810 RepID=A0A8A7KBI4_9FIRM|nr:hypothetical protein [Iocasia fonsfrigidae]QTL98600.1 hypothetical protein GM661_11815 [Iocasia fonsfrigidae]
MSIEYSGVILLTALITTGFILIFLFVWREFITKINRKIHINKKIIDESYDNVWKWFSNVNNYPKLYPAWVDEVKEVNKERYIISDQYNNTYEAKAVLDKEKGIIDLYMEGEVSRTRLFSIKDNETLVVHIGEREDFNFLAWLYLKRTVNSDFKNAKAVIESN